MLAPGASNSSLCDLDHVALDRFPLTETYERAKTEWGCLKEEEVARTLLWGGGMASWLSVADGKDRVSPVRWVTGTHIGNGTPGPYPHYDVMVVGKMPGAEEIMKGRVLCGKSGQLLLKAAMARGCHYLISNAYGTNVCRFAPPDGSSNLKPAHVKDCMPMLAQELAINNPKYVLLLGTDAVKAFFGNKFNLSKVRSHCFVLPTPYALGEEPTDADILTNEAYDAGVKIYATIHPAAVLREIGLQAGLERDLERFAGLVSGAFRGNSTIQQDTYYHYVHQHAPLKHIIDQILAAGIREIAVDCEWGGTFPTGSLRTIQFCWAPREVCVVILRRQHMHDAQQPGERAKMMMELKRLFHHPGMKIVGHNIRADAKWLALEDLPIMDRVSFDTMLADHILNENAEHGLEECAVRMTDMGRYDLPLKKWLSANPQPKHAGFAEVPDDILHPYCACDPDATFRLIEPLRKRLAQPDLSRVRHCYEKIVLPCMQPVHEIEMNGLAVDQDRMEGLVWTYDTKKRELIDHLRDLIGDPYFNFRSYPQVSRLLFGKIHEGGLELVPLKTTEKPARMWDDVRHVPEHELERLNPSTDSETLKHLAAEYPDVPIVTALADLRLVDQVSKSFMRTPEVDPYTGDEIYESGLVGHVDPDGRVRTSINQMSETGRWKSSDPNLQNLPNRQDAELKRVMGEGVHKIRSCFIADETVEAVERLEQGWVLVEADFSSAEIFTLGYLSDCPKLLMDAKSDLHGRGAVNYFGAPRWDGFEQGIKPPEEWLKEHKHLRVGAKSVNFGIPYQRGAKAVAREVTKATNGKVSCDTMQAQGYINGFYETYPEVDNFVEMAKASVIFPGYLDQPFGRRRRFSSFADDSAIAAQQREAVNFPIQSTVADLLNTAVYNLWMWRNAYPGEAEYRIVLCIHDSVFLEVRGPHVPVVVDTILPACMRHGAVAPMWKPECYKLSNRGKPKRGEPFYTKPTRPFSLDIDVELMTRWGSEPDPDELVRRGVPVNWVEANVKKGAQ